MSARRIVAWLGACGLALTACGSPVAEQAAAEIAGTGPAASVVARNIEFAPKALSMPAGVPLRIELQNLDAGVPHNIAVRGAATDVATGEIVAGVANVTLAIEPLAAGSYTFICTVHPNMTGTLTVTP